jgi:hypothetical protein
MTFSGTLPVTIAGVGIPGTILTTHGVGTAGTVHTILGHGTAVGTPAFIIDGVLLISVFPAATI